MKKLVVFAALFMAAFGAYAQDCEAIMLPYFKGNVEKMESYYTVAPEKFMFRCLYAQAAFYESDTVPAGMDVFSISTVVNKTTGVALPNDFVVDLNTLSYYAYNFGSFQVRNNSIEEGVCFTTPGSQHPYLVLRSIKDMQAVADRNYREYNKE